MAFAFQPYRSPFATSIADLMLRRGDVDAARAAQLGNIGANAALTGGNAQANAAFQGGNAWAGAIRGIGDTIAGIPGQIAATRRSNTIDSMNQIKLADLQREQAGGQAVAGMMRGDQLPAGDTGRRQQSYLDDNGLFDIPKITASLGQSGFGDKASELVKGAESINESILKHQALEQQTAQAHAIMIGDIAAGAQKMTAVGTPLDKAMDFAVQPALATKRIKPEEYAQVKQQILSLPPDQQSMALGALMDQAAKLDKGETLAEGATRVDRYGRTVTAGGPKPPTEAELAMKAAGGDPQAKAAMGILKPTPREPARTAEMDDARYRDIIAKGQMKQPVSPEDAAWAMGYEKQKTLGVDKTAAAAATRLASVQAQQNALQLRAQKFTEGEAGKRELTDKASLPYLDAVEKAETMRSVIEAAKGGNQEAAALTPLLATLGVTTSEGVKRINMAEIATVKGAGSLLERIKGKIGGVVSGQPLSPELQNDILKLSDLLEESARQKYDRNANQIIKTYGLSNDLIIPKPDRTGSVGQGDTARVRVVGPNGETGTMPASSALPPGWRKQ